MPNCNRHMPHTEAHPLLSVQVTVNGCSITRDRGVQGTGMMLWDTAQVCSRFLVLVMSFVYMFMCV
jgi:hypothetical protein